ncbi:MAG TPA: GNAT family N-acetyltransferase, partial [Pseudonocardiaceae bacterium]|nr:GNAT family N-acetyltransferase [Pseudonocardiaceae bacterium]
MRWDMVHGSELELRELGEDDIDDFVRLSRRSFGFPTQPVPRPERLSAGSTRHGAFLGGRLVGQAFDLHDQQWWGGELLAAADLAGVATAPEVRGRGVATAVLRRLLEHARDRGAVVSALFPSIAAVYRRFGWVSAGRIDFVDLPTAALPSWPISDDLEVREGGPADLPAAHELYQRLAMTRNGMLNRTAERFRRDELPERVDGLTL